MAPDHHINDHDSDYQINDHDPDFHIHDHDINQIWLHIFRHDQWSHQWSGEEIASGTEKNNGDDLQGLPAGEDDRHHIELHIEDHIEYWR